MIDSYSFGRIVIDGKTYSSDVIIFKDSVKANWWRAEGHSLCIDDLKEVFKKKPNVLIIGTGKMGVMDVPQEIFDYIKKQGIEIIVCKTDEACERFNEMIIEYNIVAALHLTC
jgi:hypothetical protein